MQTFIIEDNICAWTQIKVVEVLSRWSVDDHYFIVAKLNSTDLIRGDFVLSYVISSFLRLHPSKEGLTLTRLVTATQFLHGDLTLNALNTRASHSLETN